MQNVDASLSRTVNKSNLAFEDSGTLNDPMDKKIEALLKKHGKQEQQT